MTSLRREGRPLANPTQAPPSRRSSPCQTQGCESYAVYTVVKDAQPVTPRREKLVCRKCAAELIHLFGWGLQ